MEPLNNFEDPKDSDDSDQDCYSDKVTNAILNGDWDNLDLDLDFGTDADQESI